MGPNIESGNKGGEEVPTWGTSLPVVNVQEMVRKDFSCVPERYIRNHEERPNDTYVSILSSNVPVIDLSLLLDGHQEELKKLDNMACKDWGFFQVINHGVSSEVLQKMKSATDEFFNLPLEEKEKYAMPPNDIQGYGHAYIVSEKQKLDWTDALLLLIYPTKFRRIEYWPTTPLELKDAIEAYSNEVRKVGEKLPGNLSLIMGMEKDALLGLHEEVTQALRVNYYPPCCIPDHVMGLSPHSDSGTITILMQDDDVCGLQIHHDGSWVPIKPIPNSLVVNIENIIEIWSNGKYKSTEHRAVTNKSKARMSFASFITPNEDVEIEPLDHMVDNENSVKLYKKINYEEYLRHSTARQMEGKTHI